jgi:hypothetical protein
MDVYAYMHQKGIASQHSSFYEHYASLLESTGNLDLAFEILTEGVRKKAQPVLGLANRITEFTKRHGNQFLMNLHQPFPLLEAKREEPEHPGIFLDHTYDSLIRNRIGDTSQPLKTGDNLFLTASISANGSQQITRPTTGNGGPKIEVRSYSLRDPSLQFEEIRASDLEANVLSARPTNFASMTRQFDSDAEADLFDPALLQDAEDLTRHGVFQDTTIDLRNHGLALSKRRDIDSITLDRINPFMYHEDKGNPGMIVTMYEHLNSTVPDQTLDVEAVVNHAEKFGMKGVKITDSILEKLAENGLILDSHGHVARLGERR